MKQRQNSKRVESSPKMTSTASVSGPLGSHQFSEALPPVVQLRPYQQRWIDEKARFSLAVKSARIGLSFASGARNVLKRLERAKTTTVLSASKAQSIEYV